MFANQRVTSVEGHALSCPKNLGADSAAPSNIRKLIDDFEAYLAGGADDDAKNAFVSPHVYQLSWRMTSRIAELSAGRLKGLKTTLALIRRKKNSIAGLFL